MASSDQRDTRRMISNERIVISEKPIRSLDIAYCVSRVASYIALITGAIIAARAATRATQATRSPYEFTHCVNSTNRASGGRTTSLFALITVDAMAAQWIRTAVSRRQGTAIVRNYPARLYVLLSPTKVRTPRGSLCT